MLYRWRNSSILPVFPINYNIPISSLITVAAGRHPQVNGGES
jgi:hypothetical protein